MINIFDTITDKSQKREEIVLAAMFLDKTDIKSLEHFDSMVCDLLDFDNSNDPPHFIIDALASS